MTTSISRRSVFQFGAAASLASASAQAASSAEPKNIIFMVADGMSAGVIPLADMFSRMMRSQGTRWHQLLERQDTAHGLLDMASLNSAVTDSSAASSSWGSGSRIFNAMVNVLPDGTKLTPIGWLAKDAGRKTGLVTTATITHATPAGFAAVTQNRDDEELIATQYLDKVDVLLGGGRKFFEPSSRKDGKDLVDQYRAASYQVSVSKSELKPAAGQRLLGLYAQSHVPYTVDQRHDEKLQRDVPTLAEMTRAALTSLGGSRNGFLLQVEGARVDHAAHANDAAAQMWDQLAFDDAIAVALEYAQTHGDTLIVITSDHGNSNPGLFGVGKEYGDSNKAFQNLAHATCSFTTLTSLFGNAVDYGTAASTSPARTQSSHAAIREILHHRLGYAITTEEAAAIHRALGKEKFVSVNQQLDNVVGVLGQVVSNHTGVGWISTSHTADYTLLTAVGPGSAEFAGLHRNTEVFEKLTRLMGVHFRNPSMNPDTARRFVAAAPIRTRVDWA